MVAEFTVVELPIAAQVWLTQPLVDLKAITERHDIVEAFVTDVELRERLRDQSLKGVCSCVDV
jgi:DNA mismatch repair ATPase MutS